MTFTITEYDLINVAWLIPLYGHLVALQAPWWAVLTFAFCLIGYKINAVNEARR